METPELFSDNNNFLVDDLLDFPNDDSLGIEAAITGLSTDSCNSSSGDPPLPPPHFLPAPAPFSNDLSLPYDELAELEWLSNFAVEESFSSEDQQKLQIIQGMKARPYHHQSSQTHLYQFHPDPDPVRQPPIFHSEMPVPAKARSKRSRAPPGNWTSRLLAVSPNPSAATPSAAISSSSESEIGGKKPVKGAGQKIKKETSENSGGSGEGRRCLHCATDKTPQWRTGPMGPKTLCNACGVRYKSGRLVPEYRPAASPTFVLTKHSNSHRKVLELRRQKEMMRAQQQQQNHHHQFLQHHHHHHHHHHQSMMFDVSSSNGAEDYLIHQHIGPDFRQLI